MYLYLKYDFKLIHITGFYSHEDFRQLVPSVTEKADLLDALLPF